LFAESCALIRGSDAEQGQVHGAVAELCEYEAGQFAAIHGNYREMFARAHVVRHATGCPAPRQAVLDQRARQGGDARGIAQAGEA
jgi:hypothetical protein